MKKLLSLPVFLIAALIIALLAPAPAQAGTRPTFRFKQESAAPDSQETARKAPVFEPAGFLGLGILSLKDAAAKKIQTGASGLMFDLNGGFSLFRILCFGAGVEAVFLKDENPFSMSTTGGERSSSVWPLVYYAQAGLQAPFPVRAKGGYFPVRLACFYGAMGVSVKRSITDCIDCGEQKLSLKGGSFIRPEVRVQFESGLEIALSYFAYCDCSDLKSAVLISAGFSKMRD
jgi:hypothetical protein